MELKFEVHLTRDELLDAVRQYAAQFLPVLVGYHIEVDDAYNYYSFATKAYLAKDAEPEVADVALPG